MFFVLSGFLITRVLVQGSSQPRGAALWTFYGRRFLRLFPVYYAALATCTVLGFAALRDAPLWHWLYLSNVKFVTYGGFDPSFGPLWSLAVEEQFYLLWPWVILWTSGVRRIQVIASVLIAAVLLRAIALACGYELAAYVLTPMRADALAAGALLATWPAVARARGLVALVGIVGLLVAPLVFHGPNWLYVFIAEGAGIAVSVALVAVAASGETVISRVAAWRPLTWLGQVSYCVYVVHQLVPEGLAIVTGRWFIGGRGFVVYTTITLTIAAISWSVMERPLLRAKDRWFPVH